MALDPNRSGTVMLPWWDAQIVSESSGSWFKFSHSSGYQEVQLRFLRAVNSLNPNLIMVRVLTSCILIFRDRKY